MSNQERMDIEDDLGNVESCLHSEAWREVRGCIQQPNGKTLAEVFEHEADGLRSLLGLDPAWTGDDLSPPTFVVGGEVTC